MPINQNHTFEDLNGVKCAIVEKNVTAARVDFLKGLLEYNHFTVIVVPSPPPKVAPAAATIPGVESPVPASPVVPLIETFTVGVTDVMFNSTNAVFGRLLRTRDGHVVTLAYWEQKDIEARDEIPYYEEGV